LLLVDNVDKTVGCHADDEEQMRIIDGFVELLRPHRILDFGCGFQRFNRYWGIEYYGVDKDRKVRPMILADGEYLPFGKTGKYGGCVYFPLTISCTVLMHNKDIDDIVEEMVRVTEGYILLIEARRKPRFAYVHDYTKKFTEAGCKQLF